MRKIDELANKRFGGDLKATIEYLYTGTGDLKLNDFVDELTRDEAKFVMSMLRGDAVKSHGSVEKYQKSFKRARDLAAIRMTKDEVLNAPVNPFRAQIGRNGLKKLIMDGGIIALSLLGISSSSLDSASSLGNGIFGNTIARNLVDYVTFNRLRKELEAEQRQSQRDGR